MNTSWFWLVILLAGVADFGLRKRVHWSVGLFVYLLLAGVALQHGQPTSLYCGMLIGLFAFAMTALKPNHAYDLIGAVGALGVASTIITLYELTLPGYERMGISGNASMNGCLIVITLPLMGRYLSRNSFLLVAYNLMAFYAIFATMSSIPIGALAVDFIATLVSVVYLEYKNKAYPIKLTAFVILFGLVDLFAVGYFINPNTFTNSSGRFEGWALIWQWWVSSGKILMGLGTGMSTMIFSAQYAVDPIHSGRGLSGLAVWAHNDYLQLLFDNGVIGLVSLLLVLFYTLKRAINRPWLFASVSGYAATAFFNMPSHLPVTALVGVALVWLAHVGDV